MKIYFLFHPFFSILNFYKYFQYPGDSVITGRGTISGRPCFIFSQVCWASNGRPCFIFSQVCLTINGRPCFIFSQICWTSNGRPCFIFSQVCWASNGKPCFIFSQIRGTISRWPYCFSQVKITNLRASEDKPYYLKKFH